MVKASISFTGRTSTLEPFLSSQYNGTTALWNCKEPKPLLIKTGGKGAERLTYPRSLSSEQWDG